MAQMPRELNEFAEQVADMLRQIQPDYAVKLIGTSELLVDGRRLDLDNLYRMVSHDEIRGQEIVEHYLDQLFSDDSIDQSDMSFDLVRERIMPRIQPESIFEHLSRELVAHIPFVNGTVIVFVTDLPNMTISITTEQMIRWGMSCEELEQVARENLNNYTPELDMQFVESKEGGHAAIIGEQDGYDAARILMGGLYNTLVDRLGPDFLVAIPARDMFVALSAGPSTFLQRLHRRVVQDYNRLPYPITDELFLVTRDGVAGTILDDYGIEKLEGIGPEAFTDEFDEDRDAA
ncbi:MAG: hypothetical protein COB69_08465 [Phycisphaera sp.]|nr:MAG: hypothetical protein COB69_08465 [Phycisphaera sp.]